MMERKESSNALLRDLGSLGGRKGCQESRREKERIIKETRYSTKKRGVIMKERKDTYIDADGDLQRRRGCKGLQG